MRRFIQPQTIKAWYTSFITILLYITILILLFLYCLIYTSFYIHISYIRVDGGVTANNYLMQVMSDLFQKKLDLPFNTEMTSLGAAYMAGIYAGKD